MSIDVEDLRSLLIAVDANDVGTIKSILSVDSEEEKDLVSSYAILFISFIRPLVEAPIEASKAVHPVNLLLLSLFLSHSIIINQ